MSREGKPNSKEKLWVIRKAGEIEYPIPECGCECFECRKAHHLYLNEHALNEEYLQLLEQERKAMSDTILAVEVLETEHDKKMGDLQALLDSSAEKSHFLSEELEAERKLRLSTVYDRENEKNEAYAYREENKRLTQLAIEMQEDLSDLRRENSELKENLSHALTTKSKLSDQLKQYESEIFQLEKTNTELRTRCLALSRK